MTDPRIVERSALNPEEQAAGSDDPVSQAAAILAEAREREAIDPESPDVERRTSADTVAPPEAAPGHDQG